jgi:hypothetical protein
MSMGYVVMVHLGGGLATVATECRAGPVSLRMPASPIEVVPTLYVLSSMAGLADSDRIHRALLSQLR